MDKRKKYSIFVGIAILLFIIAVIIVYLIVQYWNNSNDNSNNDEEDNYSTVLSDGSKVNTSSKLKEPKELDGLRITNIELVASGQLTNLVGDITNITHNTIGATTIDIILVNSKGNELATMNFYVKELTANETTRLNASTTFDYSNAYNFILRKN